MNREILVGKLQDMREHYHAAMNDALAGKPAERATGSLMAGDEILLRLIEAAREGRSLVETDIVGTTIGARIRCLRELNELSQHDFLAKLGRPKSHQAWLSRLESDDGRHDPIVLKMIAKAFGISIDDLVP